MTKSKYKKFITETHNLRESTVASADIKRLAESIANQPVSEDIDADEFFGFVKPSEPTKGTV